MPELSELAGLKLGSGRFITAFDGYATFAVIGRGLADLLGTNDVPVRVGEKIRIDDYLFTIVGILENAVRNPLVPVDFNDSIMIPMKSIRRALASDGGISGVLIKVPEGADPVGVTAKVSDYLKIKVGNNGIQVQSAKQHVGWAELVKPNVGRVSCWASFVSPTY